MPSTPHAPTDTPGGPEQEALASAPADGATGGVSAHMSRRGVVAATGLVGLGVLAGCGGGGGGGGSGAQGGGGGSGGKSGGVSVATADVPVGGGTVLADQKIVVTQPKKDEFKAFSAVCTHQGCTVNEVAGGTINCPCHGSKYSIVDGAVEGGPAPRPLPSKSATVKGGDVVVG